MKGRGKRLLVDRQQNMWRLPTAWRIAGTQAWAIVVLVLAACVPDSVHPLSDPDRAVVDTRLTGLWTGKIGDEDAYLHFLPKGSSEMDIITISTTKDGHASWSAFTMFSSRIGGQWYMNVWGLMDGGKPADQDIRRKYFLARYRITEAGELMVWAMTEEAVIADIKSGKVKGEVREGRWTNDVRITAATKELAAYVTRSSARRLFASLIGTFRRTGRSGRRTGRDVLDAAVARHRPGPPS